LSDDLRRELDSVAQENEANKSEILRKAMMLYLSAQDGRRRGLKLGLDEPSIQKIGNRGCRFMNRIDLNQSPPNHTFQCFGE